MTASDNARAFGFTVLGPVSVEVGGESRPIRGSMRRGLLAALLLHANRRVSSQRLQALLWDDAPCSAVANLRNYVADLRRVVGERLESTPGGYLLRTRPGELDLDLFHTHLGSARALSTEGDDQRALHQYAQARSLWRGGSRTDLPEGSGVRRRLEALEEHALAAAHEEIDIHLGLRRWAAAIESTWEVLAGHPTNERAWGQLMRARYGNGDVAGALAAFRSAGAALRQQLGVDPGADLTALHTQMLGRDVEVESARDRASAVEIGQPGVRPNQLPHRNLGFVGRGRELAGLTELMCAHGQVAIVRGPAGVGKTALAVEWAVRNELHYPGGVLFADLGATGPEPDCLRATLTGFVRALGWRLDLTGWSLNELEGLYRSLLAPLTVLVVLDDVTDPQLADHLLPGCGASRAMLISRSALSSIESRFGATSLVIEDRPQSARTRRQGARMSIGGGQRCCPPPVPRPPA